MSAPPRLPFTLDLASFVTHLVPDEGGGMVLLVTPGVGSANGQPAYMAPQIRVHFHAAGWAEFKRQVEADGELPQIDIADRLPS